MTFYDGNIFFLLYLCVLCIINVFVYKGQSAIMLIFAHIARGTSKHNQYSFGRQIMLNNFYYKYIIIFMRNAQWATFFLQIPNMN